MLDFDLPPDRIAQTPIEPRDHARLLVAERATQSLSDRRFFELPELLRPGDLLVLNDTRVLHARLLGKRASTGGKWEGLFLRALPDGTWEMLCQTRGTPQAGEVIDVEAGDLQLTLVEKLPSGGWLVRPSVSEQPAALLERVGHVPLPPYIRKGRDLPEDRLRYQTVFAERPGAVAAPTAGLHFTPQLFERLAAAGITSTRVTLHVGLGTFQPLQSDDYTQHVMHREWGELPAEAVAAIRACKERGGRIVAVGTTSVRVLETVAKSGELRPWSGETDLFIHPPYDFKVVDALITNFHLPRTTLLLLVGAFAGVDLLKKSYDAAIAQGYRFFSYGDAMLIV